MSSQSLSVRSAAPAVPLLQALQLTMLVGSVALTVAAPSGQMRALGAAAFAATTFAVLRGIRSAHGIGPVSAVRNLVAGLLYLKRLATSNW